MKLLEPLVAQNDNPARIGGALRYQRPTWRVTCVFKRQEISGIVSAEATYEVAARTEEKARKSVRSFVLRTHPESSIESLRAVQQ